ncbi:RDD family protein [Roseobacter weihaiensis]|uniref:RDD family protein n=1 Tax=Roseobacter weihaiensis TaxID=2763262 RepID=UPI001D0A3E78|nr:RDD family protein [Roseobacter sp. H9]
MKRRQANRLRRKERRAARAKAAATILPPEGVPLNLPVAGAGVRLGAQIADIFITGAFAITLLVMMSVSGVVSANTMVAIGALLFFAIRVPYYVLAELAWNGQTIGKRMMKIKVVSHFGGSLSTHALVLRNLMKEAEVFLPGTLVLTLSHESPIASWLSFAWVTMALLIPLTNPHRMRLGDMMAGTHVVHLPVPILLADVAQSSPPIAATGPKTFVFLPHQLDHYGRFELQTLETFLRSEAAPTNPASHRQRQETLASIIDRIRKKIGYADVVPPSDHQRFLQAFYNAQRAYLEQRQLFGDKRVDKHHRQAPRG